MSYKVVINGCYGGFGVSVQGAHWLLANGANPVKVSVSEDADKWVTVVLERHDPLLVRMVETLGSEAASGRFAKLVVRELEQPLYRIDEYDGAESVEEPGHVHWTDATVMEA